MRKLLVWLGLQLVIQNSAGPTKHSGLLAKRPSSDSWAHLEPETAAYKGPGVSWIQAFSAAKSLANFNMSSELLGADFGDKEDAGLGEVPAVSDLEQAAGTLDCPADCGNSCEDANNLKIECMEAADYNLEGGNPEGADEACPEGFKALKCCVCYIYNTKVPAVREAGQDSHRANLGYKSTIAKLMKCMRQLMAHKRALLTAFQEDAKELDDEIQNGLKEVVKAAEDIRTASGSIGQKISTTGESKSGSLSGSISNPSSEGGDKNEVTGSLTGKLSSEGGDSNEVTGSPTGNPSSEGGDNLSEVSDKNEVIGESLMNSTSYQTSSSLGQSITTAEVSSAAMILAKRRALAKMSSKRSRVLMALKTIAHSGAEECDAIDSSSLVDVSLKTDLSPRKSAVQSLIEQTSGIMQALKTEQEQEYNMVDDLKRRTFRREGVS